MSAEPGPYFPNEQPARDELRRLPAADRYSRDPAFRSLVDAMYGVIRRGEMTPTEVREAAILATTKYEMLHVKPLLFPDGRR
jgi:hypothetical protein